MVLCFPSFIIIIKNCICILKGEVIIPWTVYADLFIGTLLY